jgi:hypothetical protein
MVVRCVVHDDVGVVEVFHDAVEGDDAQVSRCDLVQTVKVKSKNSGKKEIRRPLYQITRPDLHHLDPLNPPPPKFGVHFDPSRETGLSPKPRRAAAENMALGNLILSNIPVYTLLTKLATQSGK